MKTSPAGNKFRQRFAAGDWIEVPAHPPLRVLQVMGPDKIAAIDPRGGVVTIEGLWDAAKLEGAMPTAWGGHG
jgi:hypothetical protein